MTFVMRMHSWLRSMVTPAVRQPIWNQHLQKHNFGKSAVVLTDVETTVGKLNTLETVEKVNTFSNESSEDIDNAADNKALVSYVNHVFLVGKLTDDPIPVRDNDEEVNCYKLNVCVNTGRRSSGGRVFTTTSDLEVLYFYKNAFHVIERQLYKNCRVFLRGSLSPIPRSVNLKFSHNKLYVIANNFIVLP